MKTLEGLVFVIQLNMFSFAGVAQALVLVFALQELALQLMPFSTDRLKVAQPIFSPIFIPIIMLDCLKTSHFQFIVAR